MSKNNTNIGKFLTDLASKASPLNAQAIADLQDKMRAEKVVELERRIRHVLKCINTEVTELRTLRKREAETKKRIKDLEKLANDIVTGKDIDD
jgi:hypothetical protein